MTELPCWSVHLILSGGPLVAWSYTVGVWGMYAAAHEFSWGSRLPQVLGRTSWLVASIASSIGLCQSEKQSLLAILPLSFVFVGGSAVLCHRTRMHDVVGIDKAPFYGSRHLEHKVVLCTGANSGIGKETTAQLASMGATVYLLCRSPSRAQQAVDLILKHHSQTILPSQLKIVALDLGDLSSIRNSLQGNLRDIKVDILVNNAGIMLGTKTMSKDGYELMMQANHLGHFLLTNMLLSKGALAKDARILNLTSSTHKLANSSGFDFGDMMCESQRKYTLFGQYAQSKLANILFTKELVRRHPDIQTYAVHPGIVRTNVTSSLPSWMQIADKMFAWIVATMQKRPEEGAYSTVLCAAGPLDTLPANGSYIVNCEAQAPASAAESVEDAKQLWEVSRKLVDL